MRVFGVDFTSAPRPGKPITCAVCELSAGILRVQYVESLADFAAFEAFLRRPGPWIAGFDFPFGQPARLVRALRWGASWAEVAARVGRMSKGEFLAAIKAYRDDRPAGDKQHLRQTDALAGSRSPMMVYGVPVGRMFQAGAPRLLAADLCVIPCCPTADVRIALEAYPALVARKWIDMRPYKNDTRAKQTSALRDARRDLIAGLRASCHDHYGFALDLADDLAVAMIEDASGDLLDASLCAVQAAWASRQPNYGTPEGVDPLEGWIVDPATAIRGQADIAPGRFFT